VLFFVFVFSPLASIVLAKLGLHSFDVGRSGLAGLPTWYLVVAIVIVATGEEWLYRGYAIERLQAVAGNAWVAGAYRCFYSRSLIFLSGDSASR
jgi:membrane protease YdiL (CAAX protease family)